MVVARTTSGDIAFLTGHVPFVGVLETWPLRVIADDDTAEIFAVHQGFVEVSPTGPDNITKITILSDVAELGETIDVARAERAKEAATQTLADDPENVEAAAALRRAEVRLEVAGVPRSGGARLDL